MKSKLLLVSAASPHPVVTDGCSRLVSNYQTHLFADYEVYFLHANPGDWTPCALYRDGGPLAAELTGAALLARGFELVYFIGFKDHEVTRALAASLPSFCLTDTYPHPDLPAGLFRGILSHRGSGVPHPDLLLVGGSYDERTFFRDR